jgi:uncharacterized protein (TIGR02145 family)
MFLMFISIPLNSIAQVGSATIKDINGNTYKTVLIGTQVWMAENLKTNKYNDGTAIPLVTDDKSWKTLTTPAYCWFDNDTISNKYRYGALYNWYAVSTNKLCPKGWHVPADKEWTTLTTYLGGESVAGGNLKETDTTHWESPNVLATNESGFTALPSGYRNLVGLFNYIGKYGYWWSSTECNVSYGWARIILYNGGSVDRVFTFKQDGWSVRCLKD